MPITTVTVLEYSSTVPAGNVIRTDPEEGEDLTPDQVVTLYVSLGPNLAAARARITHRSANGYISLSAAT